MRKVVQMMMSIAVMAALLAGNFQMISQAAEKEDVAIMDETPEVLEAKIIAVEDDIIMPYTSLAQCIISISGHDDGMYIDITTGSVGRASVIGIKDIKIERKFWYGWSLVATCSGCESYDHSMVGICITYDNAVKDATYRITCVHYADVDGYTEGVNDTGAFVYTY